MLRNQKMPSSLENIFLKRGEKKASTSLVRKLLCLLLCVADGAAAAVGSARTARRRGARGSWASQLCIVRPNDRPTVRPPPTPFYAR